jgi:hypothetical protein
MGSATPSEEHLKELAANTEYTLNELDATAETLQETLQERLNKLFENNRLHSEDDYWLIDMSGGAWIGFSIMELAEELRRTGHEYDNAQLQAVAYAHLEYFQDTMEMTVAVPAPVARRLEDAFIFPIYVSYPEEWRECQTHVLLRFQELVWRYGMSPAEALDYWVTEIQGQKLSMWAGKRGVEPEAVRKNVRQAREKIEDESLGAASKETNIRAVSLQEVPEDSPYDEEEGIFYVPTEAKAREWDDNISEADD